MAFFSGRLEVELPLLLFALVFITGRVRLRARARRLGSTWRSLSYLLGLAALWVALCSPLDRLAHISFSMHMVQHMLLIMVAAPAVLLADPLASFLWGLPCAARLAAGRLLTRSAPLRGILRELTWMPFAWVVSAVTLWVWHHPALYQAALRSGILHDIEHLSLFVSGIIFWWPVINPSPHLHGSIRREQRIIYLVLAAFLGSLLALALIAAPRPLYPIYGVAQSALGLDPLQDQFSGGLIMWLASMAAHGGALLALLFGFFGEAGISSRRRPEGILWSKIGEAER